MAWAVEEPSGHRGGGEEVDALTGCRKACAPATGRCLVPDQLGRRGTSRPLNRLFYVIGRASCTPCPESVPWADPDPDCWRRAARHLGTRTRRHPPSQG